MSSNKKSGKKTKSEKTPVQATTEPTTTTTITQSQPEQKKSNNNTKQALSTNINTTNLKTDEEMGFTEKEGWHKIKNIKKIKAEVRKAKKKFLEETKKDEEKKNSEESQDTKTSNNTNNEPEVRKMKGQSLSKQTPVVKKKKKAKTQNNTVHISNENDLVNAIRILINNVPNSQRITVSAVGDKLQEMTGHSWNKKWKKNFGPLKTFLQGRKEFEIDSKDQIFIKEVRKQAEPELKVKPKAKKVVQAQSKPKKVKSPEQKSDAPVRASKKVESESSSVFRMALVFFLVIAVLIVTFVTLDPSSSQFIEQIKRQLRS